LLPRRHHTLRFWVDNSCNPHLPLNMAFGQRLQKLRHEKQIGLKRLAPELGIDYTYLSKLERDRARPSEEVVYRVASYFGCDPDPLLLAADRIPPDIRAILRDNPDEAADYLRDRFGRVPRP
jgi:transcriptional regulator with XRE-family HTH domain